MMEEERKCCSSKVHRGSENKVELHQFDSESERKGTRDEAKCKRLWRVREREGMWRRFKAISLMDHTFFIGQNYKNGY